MSGCTPNVQPQPLSHEASSANNDPPQQRTHHAPHDATAGGQPGTHHAPRGAAAGKDPDVQPRLLAAARLLETGQLAEAEKAARALLIESPQDLQSNTLLASILMRQQRFGAAVQTLDELALWHPDQRDVLEAQAADCMEAAGDVEDAIGRFEKIIERNAAFDDARRRLAELLNLRGYRFDANEHLRYLAGRVPLGFEELRGLLFPALTWIDVKAKPDINNPAAIESMGLLNAATALRVKSDVRDALELLADSELYRQRDPAVISIYGWVLADSQQYDLLRQWIAAAGEKCERYPGYWIAAGGLALHDQEAVAVRCFAEAIRREPSLAEAHDGIVQALEAANQPQLATEFRERAKLVRQTQWLIREIVANRHNQSAVMQLAAILKQQGRAVESLAWQELMISELSPNAPELAIIHEHKGKVLQAMPSGRDETALLCGLDLDRFDSPQEWLVAKRQAAERSLATDSASLKPRARAAPAVSPPVFTNVALSAGLNFRYRNAPTPVEREFQIFQAYGGGVACLDFDCDGYVDLYFGQASGTPPERSGTESNGFYHYRSGRYAPIVDLSGADDRAYTFGVTAGDWNQDGFPDLIIGNLGPNRLLINQGDGTFRELLDPQWNESRFTTSLAIADITGDHLPDIVEVNYLDDKAIYEPIQYGADGKPLRLPGPLHFAPAVDRVFVSQGDGSMQGQPFREGEEVASTGLGVLVTDLDGHVGNEVFVANDLRANQLWVRNDSNGKQPSWTDVAVSSGLAYGNAGMAMACMGIAAADFDGNGFVDLHITNFEDQWSNQYMQQQAGVFVDQALPYGIDSLSLKMLGFGTQAIDYDNNAFWDLVVGNGHVEDYTARGSAFAMPTQLLINRGDKFIELPVEGDEEYWKSAHWSRGLAKCDWNRDGRTDFVVTDLKQNVALLENRTQTSNHWLRVELVGTRSERDAIGATVMVQCGDHSWTQVSQSGDGYLSKNEPGLCFGLGAATSVDRLSIQWPSGLTETFDDLEVDSTILIVEDAAVPWTR